MTRAYQAWLGPLFLESLAAAAVACAPTSTSDGSKDPLSVDLRVTALTASGTAPASTATPAPTMTAVVPTPEDPTNYARLFSPVESLAKAFPLGTQLKGFIDKVDNTVCSPSPCPAAWKSLVDSAEDRNAVVMRGGILELMRLDDFPTVIGKVDTPEKAALRVRLDDFTQPASCADFRRDQYECAGRSVSSAVAVRRSEKGFEVATYGSRDVCGGGKFGRANALGVVEVDEAGELTPVTNALTQAIDLKLEGTAECHYPMRGRMFEGFVDLPPETCELEYYVRAHRHEAAAVLAFERLARELELHGAPAALIEAAHISARDEARHAALFEARAHALALKLGSNVELTMPAPEYPTTSRSLHAILKENAEEGCANETYAAVIATHQSISAPSGAFRSLMKEIAEDEREHAALAHAIHAWGLTVLLTADARELEAHRRDASRRLREGASRTDAGAHLGEPAPDLARVAFEAVDRALAQHAA